MIEEIPNRDLDALSDAEMVQHLLEQLEMRKWLNPEEISMVKTYINSRVTLIRDLAWSH
jgi:hypothetical protein